MAALGKVTKFSPVEYEAIPVLCPCFLCPQNGKRNKTTAEPVYVSH